VTLKGERIKESNKVKDEIKNNLRVNLGDRKYENKLGSGVISNYL